MTLFKLFRILLLLGVFLGLAFYAQQQKLKSRAWTAPLQLTIYPIAIDADPVVVQYIEELDSGVFAPIDAFLQQQSRDYDLIVQQPTVTRLGPTVTELPPQAPAADAGYPAVVWWGLKFRYWVWRHSRDADGGVRQVAIFVLYHAPAAGRSLPHSLGLEKGLVALVHAFADIEQDPQNNIVIAHEFLHTVGASDKYDAANYPLFPAGYAEPDKTPLYPQTKAEIMAGRIPLADGKTRMADSLQHCVIGEQTAREINWLRD